MGDSNGSWGELASHDSQLAAAWDGFEALPEPGKNEALDSLIERKNLSIESLVRVGARLSDKHVLAFAFPDGIKYRDLVTDKRWTSTGTEWSRLKIVPAQGDRGATCIVAEGETDAARLTMLYPDFDVAILPAGAGGWTEAFAAQLAGYERVLVGTDDDAAGERGAKWIIDTLPNAQRFKPPANDWCEATEAVPLPAPIERLPTIVWGDQLMELEVPENDSWFSDALLPIGGFLMLHAQPKSFKSFMAFDMGVAIATGQSWCHFEATEEPARVVVIQFEINWSFYKERCARLRETVADPELWKNFGSWEPLVRSQFMAGNKKMEDRYVETLVDSGAQVVIFDPIRRAMGGADMNSEQDVRKILDFFDRLQCEGITVVATHHDAKARARDHAGSTTAMTGSGAFAGDPDSLVNVYLPKGETENGPTRNINFHLRNGPSPSDRGFEMLDGRLRYHLEPWRQRDDDDVPQPANLPKI